MREGGGSIQGKEMIERGGGLATTSGYIEWNLASGGGRIVGGSRWLDALSAFYSDVTFKAPNFPASCFIDIGDKHERCSKRCY